MYGRYPRRLQIRLAYILTAHLCTLARQNGRALGYRGAGQLIV
jgi:hypothetical protein